MNRRYHMRRTMHAHVYLPARSDSANELYVPRYCITPVGAPALLSCFVISIILLRRCVRMRVPIARAQHRSLAIAAKRHELDREPALQTSSRSCSKSYDISHSQSPPPRSHDRRPQRDSRFPLQPESITYSVECATFTLEWRSPRVPSRSGVDLTFRSRLSRWHSRLPEG